MHLALRLQPPVTRPPCGVRGWATELSARQEAFMRKCVCVRAVCVCGRACACACVCKIENACACVATRQCSKDRGRGEAGWGVGMGGCSVGEMRGKSGNAERRTTTEGRGAYARPRLREAERPAAQLQKPGSRSPCWHARAGCAQLTPTAETAAHRKRASSGGTPCGGGRGRAVPRDCCAFASRRRQAWGSLRESL
jgi:hypothetical protein